MAMCVFCSIIAGESPAHVVFADDSAVAFLDTRPLFPGHVLVCPREHHETLADLPPDQIEPLFGRARALSSLMESELEAGGSFVAMNNRISQSVPHLHVHVVPRNRQDGLRGFFWPRTGYDDEAHAVATAEGLARAWADVAGTDFE
ncbi:MAG: HIT domain-containing protein [Actinomycetia bacterium]|nr:HIT domain-containing protein [Actinomycetes bacterium]